MYFKIKFFLLIYLVPFICDCGMIYAIKDYTIRSPLWHTLWGQNADGRSIPRMTFLVFHSDLSTGLIVYVLFLLLRILLWSIFSIVWDTNDFVDIW
jgi:hypothetical protein